MPVVRVDFDQEKVSAEEVKQFVKGLHEVISSTTNIEDVPVYANASQFSYAIAPVEVFIQLSDHKVNDASELTQILKENLIAWTQDNGFKHLINMTFIPMKWNIEIEINK